MRILLIEDYPLLRQSVVIGLTEVGYAVDVAADGDEGWWYLSSNPYDLVLLDLMLPGKSGLEVLRKLRARDGRTHVLIMTALDGVDDRVSGLDTGADDYLVKPFALPELLARVRSLLRRSYQTKSPLIQVADLELDTVAKRVRRGGTDIDLTSREYVLLEYLALRHGEVVTRTEIWEHLYDFASEGSSNVVDVYIGYLRRKIDRDDLPALIHTRRGLGYLLGIAP
ncbi:MAG TPA: response regulator transcription factor [Planctomycetota bacterium]|nr:response regulator transcription factor [Planctomycetota bacterium]